MSSLFGQPSGSLFGQNNQQQNNSKTGLFGSLNANTAVSQPQQSGGLFGSLTINSATSQPQQGSGLFGATAQPQQSSGGHFGSSQPQQQGGLFGSTQQPQQQPQQQQGGGLFGSQQQPQQGGSIFSNLGNTSNQQPHQGGSLFANLGATTNQQPQHQGTGLFGGLGQPAQQPQQNQQQGSVLGQSQGQSRYFQQSEIAPRRFWVLRRLLRPLIVQMTEYTFLGQKSVIDQIELAYAKWNPLSPNTPFQTYLYNTVPAELAPFYGPTAIDDETKWEEALNKKPSPGAIPVLVKGFAQIGARMNMQIQALHVLSGRLHEINDGLSALLQRHDLQIAVRAVECRRKHLRLSHQCMGLAAKTQVLRNRGYAMDSAEEELRKKLMLLGRQVFDPALNGRGEEIWARMVSVRERGRQLQREFERAGRGLPGEQEQVIDEELKRRIKKVCNQGFLMLMWMANMCRFWRTIALKSIH